MTDYEKDATEEVRAQGKLNHLANDAFDAAERLYTYARYNQRVDVRDQAYELQRLAGEILSELDYE